MKYKIINLEDHDVSQECGFLPTVSPALVKLPEVFKQLQQTAAMLPKLLINNKIRQAIENVPEVDVDNEILDEMQLRRLHPIVFIDKPEKLLGASGAQSAIVPAMDALLNITNESNSFHEYLMEVRDYMPPKHRAFVEAVEKHSTLRNFVKNRLNQSPKLADLYNDCISIMEKFRTQHLKLAAQYINQEATKVRGCPLNRIQGLVRPVNDNIEIDTGGTPFMRYLKKKSGCMSPSQIFR